MRSIPCSCCGAGLPPCPASAGFSDPEPISAGSAWEDMLCFGHVSTESTAGDRSCTEQKVCRSDGAPFSFRDAGPGQVAFRALTGQTPRLPLPFVKRLQLRAHGRGALLARRKDSKLTWLFALRGKKWQMGKSAARTYETFVLQREAANPDPQDSSMHGWMTGIVCNCQGTASHSSAPISRVWQVRGRPGAGGVLPTGGHAEQCRDMGASPRTVRRRPRRPERPRASKESMKRPPGHAGSYTEQLWKNTLKYTTFIGLCQ